MTDATDLAAWLTQIWDEQEKAAKAAGSAPNWRFDGTSNSGPKVIVGQAEDDVWMREVQYAVWNCDDELDGCPDSAREWSAEGRHIAANDPASVLARIAADRQILALHQPWSSSPARCHTCVVRGQRTPSPWPCDTLRLLAQPYADRPGFRNEWRVRAALERQNKEPQAYPAVPK